jgi:hypothetical protein
VDQTVRAAHTSLACVCAPPRGRSPRPPVHLAMALSPDAYWCQKPLGLWRPLAHDPQHSRSSAVVGAVYARSRRHESLIPAHRFSAAVVHTEGRPACPSLSIQLVRPRRHGGSSPAEHSVRSAAALSLSSMRGAASRRFCSCLASLLRGCSPPLAQPEDAPRRP